MKILISTAGGVIQSVSTDSREDIQVEIFDWDDKEGSPFEVYKDFMTERDGMREVY